MVVIIATLSRIARAFQASASRTYSGFAFGGVIIADWWLDSFTNEAGAIRHI